MSATTTVLLTLPGDVVQRAVRVMVHLAAAAVVAPTLALRGDVLTDYREATEAAAHEGELQPCRWCSKKKHEARWRGYPVLDPGPCPPGGVLADLLEVCACCFWGPSADPLYDRLQREAFDGRDIHVDHLGRDGRWTKVRDAVLMGRVEREVERAIQDAAREAREEIEAKARDAARTEQPEDKP